MYLIEPTISALGLGAPLVLESTLKLAQFDLNLVDHPNPPNRVDSLVHVKPVNGGNCCL